jgi:sporulation protein YqfC
MRRINRKLRRMTARFLELPKDILMDMPRITITGPYEMHIENHGGILHGTEKLIRLAIPHGALEIQGESLVIRMIVPEEVKVEGVIHSIKFL